jgi:hypothetical protein
MGGEERRKDRTEDEDPNDHKAYQGPAVADEVAPYRAQLALLFAPVFLGSGSIRHLLSCP